jgi:hypothetical protein
MTIKSNISTGVVGYNIMDVNLNEMRQMAELKNRINDVLASHAKDSKEKKYVDDDDLKLMKAILSVFTKDYKDATTSAFDEFLKEQEKPAEQPKQEKKPIRLPDDDLYGGESAI